jgi:amidophosphoribosyltransferase
MPEAIRHNCGFCVAHTLHDAYRFVRALQHRGREAAGIAAVGDGRIDVIRWKGGVDRFDITDLHKILYSPNYHTYMAHVRYATRGRKDRILEDAHPHVVGGQIECRENHILIWDCEMAAVHNGQVSREWLQGIPSEVLKGSCDTEALLHLYRRHGEYNFLQTVPGAYTWALADRRKRDVLAMRDRTGIKPGVLGWKDGKYGVASEDIAFRKNGGEYLEDLDPGTVYYLTPEGDYSKQKLVEPEPAYCFFEWNYIADVDSILNLASVRRLRESLGESLAEEFRPGDADLVTFLPRCPEVAARAYARSTALPFLPVFYKMRGERAFQGTTATDRKRSIGENLHLLPRIREVVEGKTLVMLDDSIVRGNNSRRARQLLYEDAGAAKVYLASYTPPIGVIGEDGIPRGCMFGVDMPPEPPPGDEFIARGRTQEEIAAEMEMPVVYLSRPGMLRAFKKVGVADRDLCTFCIGGRHPFAGSGDASAQLAALAQLSLLESDR